MLLFGLLVTPILYAYDYILVAPTIKTWRECALPLAVSWLAVGVDMWAGGWGGAYSLIPLTALALMDEKGEISRGSGLGFLGEHDGFGNLFHWLARVHAHLLNLAERFVLGESLRIHQDSFGAIN